jgi:hypothetical protein
MVLSANLLWTFQYAEKAEKQVLSLKNECRYEFTFNDHLSGMRIQQRGDNANGFLPVLL